MTRRRPRHNLLGVFNFTNATTRSGKGISDRAPDQPDDADTMIRLGEYHGFASTGKPRCITGRKPSAGSFDPAIHAHLAEAHANIQDRTNALRELAEATRLDPDDLSAAQFVPQVYERLVNCRKPSRDMKGLSGALARWG